MLRAHAAGPKRLSELHEQIGTPATTTLRAAIANLRELGLLEKKQVSVVPYGVATDLTQAGREMLQVAEALEVWLSVAPDGPIDLGSREAKSALKAMASGWSSQVVAALASEPLTLTEIDKRIADLSYPSLERRLAALRASGQVQRAPEDERRPAYQVTDWLRQSVAALYTAARWELRHCRDEAAPVTAIEIEAAFLLALPLAVLPPETSGECWLVAPAESADQANQPGGLAGAYVKVEDGRVTLAGASLKNHPSTWIASSAEAWLSAVIDGQLEELRVGGADPQLALSLVLGTHLALFGDLTGMET